MGTVHVRSLTSHAHIRYKSIMVVRWCLAAGLITAMLLASNYWHQGTEQSICKTLLDADGAWMSGHGIAGRYMGTKTPYNLLRQIKAVEDTETSAQDLKGCQVIKVRDCIS